LWHPPLPKWLREQSAKLRMLVRFQHGGLFCVKYFMGLEKAILHGKEKRKPYRYSQRFDYSCRNHGSCPWCLHNRTHSHRKNKLICLEKIKEFNNEWKNRQD